MQVVLAKIESGIEVFHAVHSQVLVLDLLFFLLLTSYIIFMTVCSGDFWNIINHPVRTDNDTVLNKLYVKPAVFAWSKAMLVSSFPMLFFPFVSSQILPQDVALFICISMILVMIVRPVVSKIIGFMSDNKLQFSLMRYSSNCQVVLLVCILFPPLLVSYCLNSLYVILPFVIAIYFIYHIVRTIKLLKWIDFSFFGKILYFCTLEFLPLIVFVSALRLYGEGVIKIQ